MSRPSSARPATGRPPHFAQLNIARMLVPTIDDPLMAGFVTQLDHINALADDSPGFVWRLTGETGNATSIRGFDDGRIIVNMSVWESIENLLDFAYKSVHAVVLRNRHQWFEQLEKPAVVIWPVAPGHCPTVAEARQRLEWLQAHGASEVAFDFKYWRNRA